MSKARLQNPKLEHQLNGAGVKSRPRPELLQFRNNLIAAMAARQMSASALARAMFGSAPDKRGYTVSRNRARITEYLAGTSYPEPANLIQMAKVLEIDVQSLAIQQPGARMPGLRMPSYIQRGDAFRDPKADVVVSMLADGTAILEVRPRRMTMETAMQIVSTLNAEPRIVDPEDAVSEQPDTR